MLLGKYFSFVFSFIDILVTILDPWHFGVDSADPCLWLMDPDPDSGCGSGSFYFHHWPSRYQQKANLKRKFFRILLFEGTFTSFFIGKESKRSNKAVEIKVFLKDPDPYLRLTDPDPDPGGPKTRGSGGSGSATLLTAWWQCKGMWSYWKNATKNDTLKPFGMFSVLNFECIDRNLL
jgi:hypothetical protein